MPRGIKRKEGELLDNTTIKTVISKLEQSDPITKKEACEILNISYNTTRLNKIIEEYKERKESDKKRRESLKNTPVSNEDKKFIISEYLDGMALGEIARISGRSIGLIKRVLENNNIPLRNAKINYFNPIIIEDDDKLSTNYVKGDLVFSARYNCVAKIAKHCKDNVFRIWLLGNEMQFASQPYYELIDLRKIQKELGVDIEDFDPMEAKRLIYEALQKAKKDK